MRKVLLDGCWGGGGYGCCLRGGGGYMKGEDGAV